MAELTQARLKELLHYFAAAKEHRGEFARAG
jgi:hypothetical protein